MARKRLKHIRTPQRRDRITPSKRPPREDDGPTIYQLARRAELLGEKVIWDAKAHKPAVSGNAAVDATASAIGMLLHQKLISEEEHSAGQTYAMLRLILFGPASPRGSALFKVLATDFIEVAAAKERELTPDEKEEHLVNCRISYYEADNRLRKLHYARRVREVLRRVLIDNQMPDPKRPNQLSRLREGLQVLAFCWRIVR